LVSPSSGSALITSFGFVTTSWSDVNLPLKYDFQYQISSATTLLTIQSRGLSNVASAILPVGLDSTNNQVMIYASAYDSYLAKTTLLSNSIIVSPTVMTSYSNLLASILVTALAVQDTNMLFLSFLMRFPRQ
jgi:hypothetical protein